jgi:site-specific recombinase XerD
MDQFTNYRHKKHPGRPKKELAGDKSRIQKDILEQLSYNSDLSDEQVQLIKEALQSTLVQYDIKKEEIPQNTYQDRNNVYLEEFLESKRVEAKSQTTIYNYGNEIAKMFTVINKPVEEITTQDIRRYMDYRKQHDQLKPVSINNIRMYLMSFFKWLQAEEIIIRNPIDRIGVVKAEKKVIETLSDEECEMIRCACDNERDLAIIDLLSGSGMRVSELTNLNIQDVDFEKGEVIVFGKGAKERVCFLTGRAKVHLKWYLQQRVDSNPALFVTAKKPYTRLTKNGVEFILKNIAKKSQVPRIRLYPHKYRSTLATNMLNKGAAAEQIQHILGHESVSTTLGVYARMDKESVKNAHHTYIS